MGGVMDSKCDKRRGIAIGEIEKESIIHWNVVSHFGTLREQSLQTLFRGRPLYFVTRTKAFLEFLRAP